MKTLDRTKTISITVLTIIALSVSTLSTPSLAATSTKKVPMAGRVNQILDVVARNDLKVKVDAIDELVLIEGMQKVANRITVGLILAALIVGAALMMQIDSSFRLFGYPGLAILCFMGAGGGGLILVINILVHDRPSKK